MTVPPLCEDLLRLAATVVVGLVFWTLLEAGRRLRPSKSLRVVEAG